MMSTANNGQGQWVDEAWDKVINKVLHTSNKIGANFPHVSQNGSYDLAAPHWWTAGFWPGLLWVLYEGSKEEKFKSIAEACELQLEAVLNDYSKLDHDIGFMWTLTSVNQYKLVGDDAARLRALKAANHLSGRFNMKGQYIRAWNSWSEGDDLTGVAIIDCAMNMPLLYWASRQTRDPRYAHIANAHMDTVVKHFIREDHSVRHIVRFDSYSGEVAEYLGGQGYAPESAWSRGNAWAIYGLALAYHHTKQRSYLAAAIHVAKFYIAQLSQDIVPAWDFRAPEATLELKDSSAGACAACGMLLLADLIDGLDKEEQEQLHTDYSVDGAYFREQGTLSLEALYRLCGHFGLEEDGLLLHGTSHYPEQRGIDVPLIYGDYYFVEGLARLRGKATIAWE